MNQEKIADASNVISDIDVGDIAVQTIAQKKETILTFIKSFFTWHNLFNLIVALIIILIIFLIYKIVTKAIKRIPQEKLSEQKSSSILKCLQVIFYILVLMYVLSLFGVKFSAVWGAAGIAGVALAFAAQTSVSNIISGIFIIAEKSMKVGDLITIGTETGIVDSIGLLSVQVHTLDNQLIRIPNSTIINSNMINTSFFSKRRMSFNVTVSYDCDIEKVLQVLQTVPKSCQHVLEKPEPFAIVERFSTSGIELVLNIWFKSSDFVVVKNEVFIAIKKIFEKSKIKIPFTVLKVNFLDDENIVKGNKTRKK